MSRPDPFREEWTLEALGDSTRRSESAWRSFLALDSFSRWTRARPILRYHSLGVSYTSSFLGGQFFPGVFPSGEKRIWRREGNFDNFGGEKINGDKKEARRTGRGAASRLRTKLCAISQAHCVWHNLTISQSHCVLHTTTLQRIAKKWTHRVINRG